jgi:hypothetical protein
MKFSPKAKSKYVSPVLLTAFVPIFAAVAFFSLAIIAKHGHPNVNNEPSMAAFDACLTANNIQPSQSYASQFDEQVAADQEMKVCGSKIPPDYIKQQEKKAEAANAAYRSCIEGFVGSGSGRFHGERGSGFRAAAEACQSLLQGGGGGPGRTGPPVTTKNAPGPVA